MRNSIIILTIFFLVAVDYVNGQSNVTDDFQWVVIDSKPQGGLVFINEKYVGVTPYSGKHLLGDYFYRIEFENYYNYSSDFVLQSPTEKHKVFVNLEPNFGSIVVNSDTVVGAAIFLDGIFTGKFTPDTLIFVKSGVHAVMLKHSSYEDIEIKCLVEDAQDTTLNLSLRPIYCELDVITNPPEAEIIIDGISYGTTPLTINKILAGNRSYEIVKSNYESEFGSFAVSKSNSNILKVILSPGKDITINTKPIGTDLWIDGVYRGKTPVKLCLSDNSHEIRVAYNSESYCNSLIILNTSQYLFVYNGYGIWSDHNGNNLMKFTCPQINNNSKNQNADRINNLFGGGVFGNSTSNENVGGGSGPGGEIENTSSRGIIKKVDPVGKDNMVGKIVLKITIDESGRVVKVDVLSSNCNECIQPAKDAVKQWLYEAKPGTGYQTGNITIEFKQS